jgi:hypothetical protein
VLQKTIGYFRYVDDILIIYNQKQTSKDGTVTKFNKQYTNIKFNIHNKNHIKNNKYEKNLSTKHLKQKQKQNTDTTTTTKTTRWETFTYSRNETRKISGLFKDVNMKIALIRQTQQQTNSMVLSPHVNYTD